MTLCIQVHSLHKTCPRSPQGTGTVPRVGRGDHHRWVPRFRYWRSRLTPRRCSPSMSPWWGLSSHRLRRGGNARGILACHQVWKEKLNKTLKGYNTTNNIHATEEMRKKVLTLVMVTSVTHRYVQIIYCIRTNILSNFLFYFHKIIF